LVEILVVSDNEDFLSGDIGIDGGLCVLCGRPTVRPVVSGVEEARGEEYREPFVCNKCLVDLRGEMATELEVRRQLGALEAKVEGYAWKQWILYFAFTLAFGALTFLAGVWLGS
jgi:hypothetical protein